MMEEMRTRKRKTGWLRKAARALSISTPALIVLFCASLSCPRSFAQSHNYEVRQIAPNTYVWISGDVVDQSGDQYFSRAGNVGFVITPDGVVVVNTANNPWHARAVLYEIRQRTSLPVRLVIDLGAEGDEMLGNEVFAEQRATIISTAAAENAMQAYGRDLAHRMTFDTELPKRMRGIHFTLPNQTFQGQDSITIGGVVFDLTKVNCSLPGSDPGDAVVYLPQQKVLFLGDLYAHHFVPRVDSRDMRLWIGALGRFEKWNVTTYVPGHGDPGGRANIAAFRGFLEWLNADVEGGVRKGDSLAQVEQRLLSSSAFNLPGLDLAPEAIADVYRQLAQQRSASSPRERPVPLDSADHESSTLPSSVTTQGFRTAPPPAPEGP